MKKTILVVEDERPLLEAIRIKLKKNDFEVITARNVEQAKNHLLDVNEVKVIWLDHYLLGKENGLDFIYWCKENISNYKNVPIFVVSNTASPDKIQAYLTLGVSKYYIKAEKRLEDIIEEINSFLDKPEK